MVDRRRYPRCARSLEGVQRLGNRCIPRRVTNISAGGFFIQERGLTATIGSPLVMDFAGEAGPIRITGEVAYLSADGLGVRITRVDWERLDELMRTRGHGAAD